MISIKYPSSIPSLSNTIETLRTFKSAHNELFIAENFRGAVGGSEASSDRTRHRHCLGVTNGTVTNFFLYSY